MTVETTVVSGGAAGKAELGQLSHTLERFSVTISAATIFGVLGRLAYLYGQDRQRQNDWLANPSREVLVTFLLAIFLVVFRAKMMHDDVTFFADLGTEGKFRTDKWTRRLIKTGLLCGYIAWLLWAPAIYFLSERNRVFEFMLASLAFSTIWSVIDTGTRQAPEWRRLVWIFVNMVLALLLFISTTSYALEATVLLVLLSVADWIFTDAFRGLNA